MSLAVSVVIPVLDDAERVDRCLAALARQTFTLPFEVIVVDSGSSDDPGAFVAGYEFARLIEEQATWLERGYARTRSAIEPSFVAGRIEVIPHDAHAPTGSQRLTLRTSPCAGRRGAR